MKKLMMMIVTTILLSQSAMATSLAPRVNMAQITGYTSRGAYELKVNNYGETEFTNLVTHHQIHGRLPTSEFYRVNELARALANEKVRTTESAVVCMMISPGAGSDLKVSSLSGNYFTGRMHMLLSEEGCWLHRHTSPVQSEAFYAARDLKTYLESVANQAIHLAD